MSEFIKQCKGLDADKLVIDDSEMFYASVKYDGVYIQIHKTGDVIQFFTSGGKEFTCNYVAEFLQFDFDFKIETEYICDGGRLRTRAKADNEIKKAVKDSSFLLTGEFKIHDVLDFNNKEDFNYDFRLRLQHFSNSFGDMFCKNVLFSYKEAKQNLENYTINGWEGLFLKKPTHKNISGKKSKDSVKLKNKFTADLVCIGWDGYYLLLRDDKGLTAKVAARGMENYISIGDIVEIEYEQIIKTYNQAVFKRIRHDKM